MASLSWLWPSSDTGGSDGVIGNVDKDSTKESQDVELNRKFDSNRSKVNADVKPIAVASNGVNTSYDARETRTPERSSPCSIPGTRQEDDLSIATSSCSPTWNANQSLASCRSSPIGSVAVSSCSSVGPPKPRRAKRLTASQAYKRGLLFQYLTERCADLNCCIWDRTSEDYYQSNWKGHQPLSEPTWNTPSIQPAGSFGASSHVSASELRLMRRRRRRGVLLPPRRNARVGSVVDPRFGEENVAFARVHSTNLPMPPTMPGSGEWSIGFPGDVVDPHLVAKKKWEPHPDEMDGDLPLPPRRDEKPGGCNLIAGCA
mmetsp:Transcript_18418/g.38566  ORF Transcript_18418/g.38566 Transcript_18418/m.38566 type:complete len:316 (-) Transcript_18418:190-1137(-)